MTECKATGGGVKSSNLINLGDCDVWNSVSELRFGLNPTSSQLFEQPLLDVLRLEAINDGVYCRVDEQNSRVQAEGKSYRLISVLCRWTGSFAVAPLEILVDV